MAVETVVRDVDLTLLHGPALEALRELPAESVHCCVTSPPYHGLRDYGTAQWEGGDPECEHSVSNPDADRKQTGFSDRVNRGDRTRCLKCGAERIDGQLGLEPTIEEYVQAVVEVFREVRRVLRKDGTVWLNLGDSYGGVSKQLGMVPARVALALQEDGWWLRQDIIWSKPNAMPESVTDRPSSSHEHVFLLARQARYFYDQDAVREPYKYDGRRVTHVEGRDGSIQHRSGERWPGLKAQNTPRNDGDRWNENAGRGFKPRRSGNAERKMPQESGTPEDRHGEAGRGIPWEEDGSGRNLRSVWEIVTQPFPGLHFAVFPHELARRCIRAGTSEAGCCPECGTPWERVVEVERPVEQTERQVHLTRAQGAGSPSGVGGTNSRTLGTAAAPRELVGWRPGCACAGVDLTPIDTPTGERAGDDPTTHTGRKGMNRPRGENEGRRVITRHEQAGYAEQLRTSPHRAKFRTEAGPAFEHYLRTDEAGARPVPAALLESWIGRGLLERVEIPGITPAPPIPCTVLDPFAGSGTVGLVARAHRRHAVLIELSADYCALIAERTAQLSLLAQGAE